MHHYLHNVLFAQNIILTSEIDHYLHNVLFTQNIILTSEMDHYPHNVLNVFHISNKRIYFKIRKLHLRREAMQTDIH